MTVHFIGAGPGAPDLITVRGQRLIARCPVCLYAGSLVPRDVIANAPADARVLDTAPMTLGAIIEEMTTAHEEGLDVARVHSGDPSIYSAIAEQIHRLDARSIPWEITPGVAAFSAAAAAIGRELTVPGVAQTVILTRTAMQATEMPAGEDLAEIGRSSATLAIHLSVRNLRHVCRVLGDIHGPDYPVVVVYRASWPDQRIIRGTLETIHRQVRAARITRTALILVGRAIGEADGRDSALYDPDHVHLLRPRRG